MLVSAVQLVSRWRYFVEGTQCEKEDMKCILGGEGSRTNGKLRSWMMWWLAVLIRWSRVKYYHISFKVTSAWVYNIVRKFCLKFFLFSWIYKFVLVVNFLRACSYGGFYISSYLYVTLGSVLFCIILRFCLI